MTSRQESILKYDNMKYLALTLLSLLGLSCASASSLPNGNVEQVKPKGDNSATKRLVFEPQDLKPISQYEGLENGRVLESYRLRLGCLLATPGFDARAGSRIKGEVHFRGSWRASFDVGDSEEQWPVRFDWWYRTPAGLTRTTKFVHAGEMGIPREVISGPDSFMLKVVSEQTMSIMMPILELDSETTEISFKICQVESRTQIDIEKVVVEIIHPD
jgi:hypothetical protein